MFSLSLRAQRSNFHVCNNRWQSIYISQSPSYTAHFLVREIYCGTQSVSARGLLSWSLVLPRIVAVFIIVSLYEPWSMAKEMLLCRLFPQVRVNRRGVSVCVHVCVLCVRAWALVFPRQINYSGSQRIKVSDSFSFGIIRQIGALQWAQRRDERNSLKSVQLFIAMHRVRLAVWLGSFKPFENKLKSLHISKMYRAQLHFPGRLPMAKWILYFLYPLNCLICTPELINWSLNPWKGVLRVT